MAERRSQFISYSIAAVHLSWVSQKNKNGQDDQLNSLKLELSKSLKLELFKYQRQQYITAMKTVSRKRHVEMISIWSNGGGGKNNLANRKLDPKHGRFFRDKQHLMRILKHKPDHCSIFSCNRGLIFGVGH
jgi:hypothetical protein